MTDNEKKLTYINLATHNYDEINNSNTNYCIYCYGITKDIKKSKINTWNIYWINDKKGFTGACTKCSIDAIIPGNYFINKNDNEICKQLNNWYKEGFT